MCVCMYIYIYPVIYIYAISPVTINVPHYRENRLGYPPHL